MAAAAWLGDVCEPQQRHLVRPAPVIERAQRAPLDTGCPTGTYADGPYVCKLKRPENASVRECIVTDNWKPIRSKDRGLQIEYRECKK